jgi:hypothetical protein
MKSQYEVLNPWADADPIPLRGISARPADLAGKTIGLFAGYKLASRPVLDEVEKRLKERFSTAKFSLFQYNEQVDVGDPKKQAEFEKWLNGADAVVCAVGD